MATWYLTEPLEDSKNLSKVFSLVNGGFYGHFLRQTDLREYKVSPVSEIYGDSSQDTSFILDIQKKSTD